MDFETCIASHSSVLMEGALGERLKREYGLTINEDVDVDAFRAAAEQAYTDLNMIELRDRIQSEMAKVA